MFCPNCGKEIKDGVNFCPECGAAFHYQEQGSQEYSGNYSYGDQSQPYYNPQNDQYNHIGETKDDEKSILLNLLSFIFPIVGIILFFVYDDKAPIKAKGCLKWALISVIASVVLSVISVILYFTLFTHLVF